MDILQLGIIIHWLLSWTRSGFHNLLDHGLFLQIEFQSSTAFEMLRIAEDLEIVDLQAACEQHFLDSLSVDSAAEFLTDAMSLSGGSVSGATDSLGARALVDKCITFMEDNAEDIVKTEGFFHLPKPALIKLISSDKVRWPGVYLFIWPAWLEALLTLSLPRMINFKFFLQLHQKYHTTQCEELVFHSLLRREMIILPILITSLIHFSLKCWENVLFDLGVVRAGGQPKPLATYRSPAPFISFRHHCREQNLQYWEWYRICATCISPDSDLWYILIQTVHLVPFSPYCVWVMTASKKSLHPHSFTLCP